MYANATGGDGQFGGGATDGNVDFHAYAGSIVNTNGLELGGMESDDSIGAPHRRRRDRPGRHGHGRRDEPDH